ncbi:MAG: hypothetical protein K1X92_14700 [Bacteroidia bacterium]|nr:hypothetical protein [Bacteroidia bacterium]
MKEYHNWEEWMKDKLENEEVVFQEAHWENAQRLLNQSSPDTRRPLWKRGAMGLFLLLLLSVVGFSVFKNGYFSGNQNTESLSSVMKTDIRSEYPVEKINSDTDRNGLEEKVSSEATPGNEHNIDLKGVKTGLEEGASSEATPDKKETKTQTIPNQVLYAETIPKTSTTTPQGLKKPEETLSRNPIQKKSIPSAQKEKNTRVESYTAKMPENITGKVEIPLSSGMNTNVENRIASANAPSSYEGKSINTEQNSPGVFPKEATSQILDRKASLSPDKTAELRGQSGEKENNIMVSVKPRPLNVTGIHSELPDLSSGKELLTAPSAIPGKSKRRNGDFYIFAGTSLQPQSLAFSPALGAGYRRMTGKGFGITTFINYAVIRNFPNITKQVNQTQYGLGFENTAYILTTKSLHFAEAGVGFSIPFQRNELFGGINASRLIYSAATLEVVKSNSFGQKGITSENVSGYTQGLEKWDLGISGGYGFSVLRNMQFRMSAHYGFRDLTQNDFFGNTVIHRNAQLRAGVLFRF